MSPRRISARDARANFGDLLGSVYYTRQPVIVEKKGRPFAVVICPEDFARLQTEREAAFAVIDRIRERNAEADPDEVLKDVTAEVETVRQAKYEERRQATNSRR